jgi:cytochrome b
MIKQDEIKVWDLFVRVFHWALAALFVVAYVTGEEWLSVHVAAGYAIAGLLVLRILWGFAGPSHARFSDFVRGPTAVAAYLRTLFTAHPRRYLGHNPAGGLMIVLMLVGLVATSVTGLVALGAEEGAGPLAGWVATGEAGEWAEELHEFFANFTVLLVLVHIAGVLVESLLHGENLVRAMLTGRKRA